MSVTTVYTGCSLSEIEVADFILRNDHLFDGKLSNYLNYARVVSLAHFDDLMLRLKISAQRHVGVVSGSLNEPELKFLQPEQTTILSFETDHAYDLDQSWLATKPKDFSLTICNQTFEHVFNAHVAFRNLVHHTAVGGYIYVSIPTINCIHGEPYFYSSGFHPRFLERLAVECDVEAVNVGSWGSYKYMINSVSGKWLPEKALRRGRLTRKSVKLPGLIFQDGRINQPKYITDCWGLFRRRA
jgi:SAM-dependent methyltransferase